jgi:hypothetical protein
MKREGGEVYIPWTKIWFRPCALVSQDRYRTIDMGRIISPKKERSGVIEKEGDWRG